MASQPPPNNPSRTQADPNMPKPGGEYRAANTSEDPLADSYASHPERYTALPYTTDSPLQPSPQTGPYYDEGDRLGGNGGGFHQGAYAQHSIDLSDGHHLPAADSYSSQSRLHQPDENYPYGGRGVAMVPPGETPPVPKLHIDMSQGTPYSQSKPPSPYRQTLSEKVMKSGYETPPALSRGTTNDAFQSSGPYKNISNSDNNMVFAEGDFLPKNKASSLMLRLFTANIVVRWFCFITPIMLLLWIPGIVGLTAAPNARVWGVKLVFWSAWLSVWWGGWWVGLTFSKLLPGVLHHSIGAILPGFNKWIGFLHNLKTPITVFVWALLSWVLFQFFILKNQLAGQTGGEGNPKVLSMFARALFGVLLSSIVLVGEKLVIQIIAAHFHRKSYEDRILEQKASIRVLVALYVNSHDIGRDDTLDRGGTAGKQSVDPAKLLKSALKGVKNVAQASTTAFGTVASEIAGERILQPNAPDSMVTSALTSSNKTRQLARRLYFSFVPPHRPALTVADIARYFPSQEQAESAFRVFDRDENGDASLEEVEMSCMDLHRERLALASSMRDLDSAVGRLDAILMFFTWIFAILIIVALLDVSFQTMLASAGTLILGLSWLIGSTAQEILSSIIFLFVKHPYDVSDRVDIDGQGYVVLEMHLLYTVFRQLDGKLAQIPHSTLNTKTVVNIRRSGAISETFEWNVAFDTSFESIEKLRNRMLEFLEAERRDFLPAIDISVKDFEDQGKMSLKCDIKYKSNWQNGTLKVQRRNKFLCALKLAMAELSIFGPEGAGNPVASAPETQFIKLITETPPPSPSRAAASRLDPGMTDAQRIDTFSNQSAAIDDSTTDIYTAQGGRQDPKASNMAGTGGGSGTAPLVTGREARDATTLRMRGPGVGDREMSWRCRNVNANAKRRW